MARRSGDKKGLLSRRGFLIGGATAGTCALIGFGFLASVDTDGRTPAVADNGDVALNAWVRFTSEGEIIFAVPRTEMGQGIYTALPMLLAEELEISLDDPRVRVEFPTEALPVYTNFTIVMNGRPEDQSGPLAWLKRKVFASVGPIVTGGSTSVVDAFVPLRQAGAVARELLMAAAAKRWNIPRTGLRVEGGHVISLDGEKRASYQELAPHINSSDLSADQLADIPLKAKSDWKVIGTPQKRLDLPAKVNGSATFGIDVVADDILIAAIKHAPSFGTSVQSADDSACKAVHGYQGMVNLGHAVAVVAEDYYHAQKALGLLKVSFTAPENPLDTVGVTKALVDTLENGEQYSVHVVGDAPAALAAGSDFSARYSAPYLAHATLEPMNCSARITPEKGEIWCGSQSPLFVRNAINASKHSPAEVDVHTMLCGGGFGRRSEGDVAREVVAIADEFPGKLVKLIWSREADTQQDVYRPAAEAAVEVRLDEKGYPAAVDYVVAAQAIGPQFAKRNLLPTSQGGPDEPNKTEGANADFPYGIANYRSAATHVDLPVPVGYWRSVGHSYNAFFVETMIDELAHKAGVDPMNYRQTMVENHPRWQPLIAKLRAASNWDVPLSDVPGVRRARGVAIAESFRSYVGQVVEVVIDADNQVRVDRITCVTDVGTQINPDTLEAQMQGGIIYGLTAAYHGQINLADTAVQNGNFDSYPMLELSQCPDIAVHLMDNDHAPGGAGEPGLPPIAPALCNAIFAASGTRLRKLPITQAGFSAAY